MNRYLVVFIKDGQFLAYIVIDINIQKALNQFIDGPIDFDDVYSITTAH